MDKPTVTWINITGIHQTEIIEKLGKAFHLHPLLMEDVVNAAQRPKMEVFDNYVFVVLKMFSYDEKDNEIKTEQVSLVLHTNTVISFQECEGGVFDPIRERIKKGKGRIRKKGADYLFYALIDAVVDSYFTILNKLGEKTEHVEEQMEADLGSETLSAIHTLRKEIMLLRSQVWPLREIVTALLNAGLFQAKKVALGDPHSHLCYALFITHEEEGSAPT